MATPPTLATGWKNGPADRDPNKKSYIYTFQNGSRIFVNTKNNVIVNTTAYAQNGNVLYSQIGTGQIQTTSPTVTEFVNTQTQQLKTSLNAGQVSPMPGSPTIQVNPAAGIQNPFGAANNSIKDIFKTISNDFGKNDEEIKKVLVYPYDAIYTQNSNINNVGKFSQDHLVISKYKYHPPYAKDLFKEGKEIFKSGLIRGNATPETILGMVMLPMPNNISDSNNVSWADDNMNNLTAGVLSTALSNPTGVIGSGAATATVAALLASLTGGNPISGATSGATAGAAAALYLPIIQALMSGNDNMQSIGSAAGISKVLSAAGFSVSPESILARGAGIIPNSNLELLFNAPTIREFQFQYRMSPRSSTEAKEIKSIIKFFKRGMAPKKQNSTSGTGASYFLGTPNVFKLNYKTNGDGDIEGVNKIKTCALTGFAVNYAADGSWAAYDNGQPVSYILNMSFKELEPVYDTDYDRTDNTVGY
jgi:hypothetical protein